MLSGTQQTFSKVVTENDTFLNLPLSTQAYYFHLVLEMDDTGEVYKPVSIAKKIGAKEIDMKLLIENKLIEKVDDFSYLITDHEFHNRAE